MSCVRSRVRLIELFNFVWIANKVQGGEHTHTAANGPSANRLALSNIWFFVAMNRSVDYFTLQYPTSAVASENDPKSTISRKPGSLPDGVCLDVAVKDLLLRLLEVDPTKRLRSLRTLQTIAFYKGFDFEKVKEKKVKGFSW